MTKIYPIFFLSIFLIFAPFFVSTAQSEERKRPSWSEDLPERTEQPELELDSEKPDSDFDLSRDDLFGADSRPKTIDDKEKAVETSKLAAEAEAKKAAEDEAARLAAEAEAKKAAEDEAARLAAEVEAKKAAEEEAVRLVEKEKGSATETSKPPVQKYSWKVLKKVNAEYPKAALRNRKEGWVDVELTVQTNGLVSKAMMVKSSRSSGDFIQSALRSVKKWQYEPPSNFGIKSPLKKIVRIEFKL